MKNAVIIVPIPAIVGISEKAPPPRTKIYDGKDL